MKPVAFVLDQELPPLAQAASLALGILGVAKSSSLAEMGWSIPASVTVSDGDVALLNEHREVLSFLRNKTPDSPVAVTVAVCSDCGRWILMSSGTAPKNCKITPDCGGSIVRASKARRATAKDLQAA